MFTWILKSKNEENKRGKGEELTYIQRVYIIFYYSDRMASIVNAGLRRLFIIKCVRIVTNEIRS